MDSNLSLSCRLLLVTICAITVPTHAIEQKTPAPSGRPPVVTWSLPSASPSNTVIWSASNTFHFTCVANQPFSKSSTVPTSVSLTLASSATQYLCVYLAPNPTVSPTTPGSKTSVTINATLVLPQPCIGTSLTPVITFTYFLVVSPIIPTNGRTWTFSGPPTITSVSATGGTYPSHVTVMVAPPWNVIFSNQQVTLTISGTGFFTASYPNNVTFGSSVLNCSTSTSTQLICI